MPSHQRVINPNFSKRSVIVNACNKPQAGNIIVHDENLYVQQLIPNIFLLCVIRKPLSPECLSYLLMTVKILNKFTAVLCKYQTHNPLGKMISLIALDVNN